MSPNESEEGLPKQPGGGAFGGAKKAEAVGVAPLTGPALSDNEGVSDVHFDEIARGSADLFPPPAAPPFVDPAPEDVVDDLPPAGEEVPPPHALVVARGARATQWGPFSYSSVLGSGQQCANMLGCELQAIV